MNQETTKTNQTRQPGLSRPVGAGQGKTTTVRESVKQEAAALGRGIRAMQEGSRRNLPRPTMALLCGPTVDLETLVAFRVMRSLMEAEAEVQGARAATGTTRRSVLLAAKAKRSTYLEFRHTMQAAAVTRATSEQGPAGMLAAWEVGERETTQAHTQTMSALQTLGAAAALVALVDLGLSLFATPLPFLPSPWPRHLPSPSRRAEAIGCTLSRPALVRLCSQRIKCPPLRPLPLRPEQPTPYLHILACTL